MLNLFAEVEHFPRHGWLSSSFLLLLVCLGTLAKYSLLNSKKKKKNHIIHPFRLKTCLQKCESLPQHSPSFLPVSSQLSGDAGARLCSPSERTTLLGLLLCIEASQHQQQGAAARRGSHQVALPAFLSADSHSRLPHLHLKR